MTKKVLVWKQLQESHHFFTSIMFMNITRIDKVDLCSILFFANVIILIFPVKEINFARMPGLSNLCLKQIRIPIEKVIKDALIILISVK